MNTSGPTSLESSSGVASGSRENMTGPDDGRDTGNRLHDVDLQARGEFVDDHQRDRDSNGTAGERDDSLVRRGEANADRYGVSRGD